MCMVTTIVTNLFSTVTGFRLGAAFLRPHCLYFFIWVLPFLNGFAKTEKREFYADKAGAPDAGRPPGRLKKMFLGARGIRTLTRALLLEVWREAQSCNVSWFGTARLRRNGQTSIYTLQVVLKKARLGVKSFRPLFAACFLILTRTIEKQVLNYSTCGVHCRLVLCRDGCRGVVQLRPQNDLGTGFRGFRD